MHKTILFPTDFTVGSLNIVRSVLQDMRGEQTCRILLVHGYRPADSITDLLFSSRASWVRELSNTGFDDACAVIRNKFESRITGIHKDVFTGSTQSAFNNYLEGNGVREIHLPQDHVLSLTSKRSFDLVPFIRRSGLVVNEVKWQETARVTDRGMVAEVFQEQMALQ
ncbi:MAG: hypothetical protein KIT10_11765 [Flavobacteriales bacterium]|nr:hypothetical protein [Flavobacteriales bacterium]